MDPALQEQLLEALRDARAPEAIGWWPLAIGWWILIALLVTFAAVVSYLVIRNRNQNEYRRDALTEANKLYSTYMNGRDSEVYLNKISHLVRRVIADLNGRDQTANLSGMNWVNVVNKYGLKPLSKESTDALAIQLYRPEPVVDVESLHHEVCNWIKQHRLPKESLSESKESISKKIQSRVKHV